MGRWLLLLLLAVCGADPVLNGVNMSSLIPIAAIHNASRPLSLVEEKLNAQILLNQDDESAKPDIPAPRSEHTMVSRAQDALYIFGGRDGNNKILSDFWSYDLHVNMWFEVGGDGSEGPSKRTWHSMAMKTDWSKVYIFGGFDGAADLNDLWRFSFADNQWKKLEPRSTPPLARDRCSMVAFEKGLIVFGGYVGTYLNDMWQFSFEDNAWSEVIASSTSALGPARRRSHSATVSGKSMFIFGGYNGARSFADMWEFDFTQSLWIEVRAATRPSKRSRGGLVGDRLGHVFSFGGFDGANFKFDLWSHTNGEGWIHLDPDFDAPVERADFSMSFGQSQNAIDKGRLFVFGGSDGRNKYNDLYKYEVGSNQWQQLHLVGNDE